MKHLDTEILEKLELWKEASRLYYASFDYDNPVNNELESPLSDAEFDSLTRELIAVGDDELTEFLTTKIQTIDDGLVDVKDVKTEMVSLFKIDWIKNKSTMTIRDITKFLNVTLVELGSLYISLKYDGHAIKVVFKDEIITGIYTRGGQDITEHLINSKGIKILINTLKKNDYSLSNNIYHCELVLEKDIFNSKWINKNNEWKKEYKNPRNAVSGVLKLAPDDLTIIPLTDGVNPLIKLGNWLTVDDYLKRHMTSNGEYSYMNLADIYQMYKSDKYQFRVDGFVIGFITENQIIKDNYPINLVSIKFEALTAVTTITGVEWTQKKTGKLTPVYELEPTLLDGTTVSKASGYNMASMKELKAGIGAVVEIEKSNDIIPKVIRVIKKSTEYVMPKVAYKMVGRDAYSLDDSITNEQKFILGMKTLSIDGIGDKTAEDVGGIMDFDVINLFDKKYKLALLDLLGDSVLYSKICTLYDTKTIPLDNLIHLLQFNGVGIKLANRFALLFTGMSKETSNIDRNVLEFMVKGDGKIKINESINRLKELGIKIIKPLEINDTTLTYELSGNPRNAKNKDEFKQLFQRKFPNAVHTSLTKNTKLLIVEDISSSTGKANKARKYNVQIISYEQALTTYTPSENE